MSRIRTLFLCLLAVALGAAALAVSASAATCAGDTWTNAAGGEWETAGNWSAGVPTSGSHVCIEKAVTVTLTDGQVSPIPVASLDLGGEGGAAQLHVSIHDVVESATTTIGPHATLTLDGTYHGANGGNASLRGGTVENQGMIVMQGTGYSATLAGTVVNEGTIDVPFGTVSLGEGSNGELGSLVNRGMIDVSPASANPEHPAAIEAIAYPITDDAGAIVNNGTFVVEGANGTAGGYTQGNGSESGNPIQIGRDAALSYTGGGASNVEVHNSTAMTGSLAAGQKLQIDIGTVVTEPSSFTNAGAITLNGNYYGGGGGPAEIALSSGAFTNTGSILAESNDNDPAFSGNVVNQGTVTVTPNTQLEQISGAFTNLGTLAPQLSSSASSSIRLDEGTHFLAGGTFAPTLLGGFVPSVGQEFEVVIDKGGSWSGTFGAVANGFGADYTHSGYIAAIYGEPSKSASTPPSTSTPASNTPLPGSLSVKSIHGGRGRVEVTLACAAGGAACSSAAITVTITEHLKGKRVGAITARSHTKRVTIAAGAFTLAAGATKTKTLTLNRAALALLAKHGSLPATVAITYRGRAVKRTAVRITRVKATKRK